MKADERNVEREPPETPSPASGSTHGQHAKPPKARKRRMKKSSRSTPVLSDPENAALTSDMKTVSEDNAPAKSDEYQTTFPAQTEPEPAAAPVTTEDAHPAADRKPPPKDASDNKRHLRTPSVQHSATTGSTSPSPRTFSRKPRSSLEIMRIRRELDRARKLGRLRRPPTPSTSSNEALQETDSKGTLPKPSNPESGERRRSTVRFGSTVIQEIDSQSDPSHLPNRLNIAVGAFMVISMCIILYMLYYLNIPPKEKLRAHCVSKTCLDATIYLGNITDERFDPCVDFYSYTCASWTNKVDTDVSFIRDSQLSLWRDINRTLHGVSIQPDRYGSHILQAFYVSCYSFLESGSLTEQPHVTFEKHFGGLQDFIEKSYSDLLGHLTRISLTDGVDSVFGVRVIQEEGTPKLYVIRSPSIREKLSGDGKENANEYLLELIRNFSKTVKQGLSVKPYHQEVLALDREIEDVFSVNETIEDVNIQDIQNLTNHVSSQMWLQVINDTLRMPEVLEGKIKFESFNCTRRALVLLEEKADDKLRALYLYLQLAAEILHLDFRRRFAINDIDNVHLCLAESQKVLTHTWSHLYASFAKVTSADSALQTLYTRISDAVLNMDYINWMDERTQLKTMRIIKKLTLTMFPAASNMVFPSDTTYANINVLSIGFLNDFIALLAMEQRQLHRFPPGIHRTRLNRLQLDGAIEYFNPLNSVVIPAVYSLPHIFYSAGVPPYFDVATVGVLIAKVLSQAIGPVEGGTFWSNATKESFKKHFRCLRSLHQGMSSTYAVDEGKLINAIFMWTRSLRIAYDLTRAQDIPPKYLFQEADKTFFKRFCLLSCSSRQEPLPLTPREQCMLPVLNMREFSEAFECPEKLGFESLRCRIL
ncbi:uncharacterized protein LOC135399030 [Ornithodoros turicata]|uniref:uncharacterized protein LOC135399030 n=1 Tax=Ornithodoros turicata TaxID=34597 RepID=UPI003138D3C5